MTRRNAEIDFEQQYIPEPNSGCWLWLGSSPNGRYGSLKWAGKRVLAHRLAYQLFKGPVTGEVDHVCRNTFCVNPDHLQLVDRFGNMRRSLPAIKTSCLHGHPYASGVDTYYRKDRPGVRYRRCLTCYRMRYPGTST